MKRLHFTGLILWVFLAIGLLAMPVNTVRADEDDKSKEFTLSWDLCQAATHSIERKERLPDKILKAISIAESGRRDDLNKSIVAWTWTVTSGSKEWYLDSKAEAVAHARSLIRSGIRNIDVGCMQINLHYHGKNFNDLEHVFDPLTNVSYAAVFLKKLYKGTSGGKSGWMTAVGNYHSRTPEFHNRYRVRVAEIWKNQRSQKSDTAHDYAVNSYFNFGYEAGSSNYPPIDTLRTARLNDAFRKRISTNLSDSTSGEGGIGSMGGDNWKSTYLQAVSTGESYLLQAQMNRIRSAAAEQQRIDTMVDQDGGLMPVKRKNDLNEWRKLYGLTLNTSGN